MIPDARWPGHTYTDVALFSLFHLVEDVLEMLVFLQVSELRCINSIARNCGNAASISKIRARAISAPYLAKGKEPKIGHMTGRHRLPQNPDQCLPRVEKA